MVLHRVWSSGDKLTSLAFSADGGRLLSTCLGDAHRDIQLWNTDSWRNVGFLRGHTGHVRQCLFTPDGQRAISCCDACEPGNADGWPAAPSSRAPSFQ